VTNNNRHTIDKESEIAMKPVYTGKITYRFVASENTYLDECLDQHDNRVIEYFSVNSADDFLIDCAATIEHNIREKVFFDVVIEQTSPCVCRYEYRVKYLLEKDRIVDLYHHIVAELAIAIQSAKKDSEKVATLKSIFDSYRLITYRD